MAVTLLDRGQVKSGGYFTDIIISEIFLEIYVTLYV